MGVAAMNNIVIRIIAGIALLLFFVLSSWIRAEKGIVIGGIPTGLIVGFLVWVMVRKSKKSGGSGNK